MQKIIPHLWFDKQAEEAVDFYTSIYKNSKILSMTRYGEARANFSGMQEGKVLNLSNRFQKLPHFYCLSVSNMVM